MISSTLWVFAGAGLFAGLFLVYSAGWLNGRASMRRDFRDASWRKGIK